VSAINAGDLSASDELREAIRHPDVQTRLPRADAGRELRHGIQIAASGSGALFPRGGRWRRLAHAELGAAGSRNEC